MVDVRKLNRFLSFVKRDHPETELIFCVDSDAGFETIKYASLKNGLKIFVQILVNVGYDRCGLDPGDSQILDLANKINRSKSLQFLGIATHNGLTYGAKHKKANRQTQ